MVCECPRFGGGGSAYCQDCRVVLIILISRFVPYRVYIFVSERRSIAGYVTERTDETWCKANAIKLV